MVSSTLGRSTNNSISMSRAGYRVYIGNLSPNCRKQDLELFFKGYGYLIDILIKQGYGFVKFETYRDADDAVYDLDGKDFMEKKVRVEHVRQPGRVRPRGHSRYGPPVRTNYRVIVKNLSPRISWQDLKDIMRKAGNVTYCEVHKDRKNEGVVEFATKRDMERAIYMFKDYNLNGRRIRIYEDRMGRLEAYSRSQSHRSRYQSKSSRTIKSRKLSSPRSWSSSGNKNNSKSSSRSRIHRGGRMDTGSRSKSPSKRSISPSMFENNSKSGSRSNSRSGGRMDTRLRSESHSQRSISPLMSKNNSKSGSRSRSRSGGRIDTRSLSKSPSQRYISPLMSENDSKSGSRSRSHSGGRIVTRSRSKSRSKRFISPSMFENNSKSGSRSSSRSGGRIDTRSRSKSRSIRSISPSMSEQSRSEPSRHSNGSKRSLNRDDSNDRDSKKARGLKSKSSLEE